MNRMTLAIALKHKNRVGERISKVSSDVSAYNSTIVGSPVEVDVRKLDTMRKELMEHLIRVKTRIHEVTAPVRAKIFRIGELRQAVSHYKSIRTTHGKHRTSYQDEVDTEYVSIMRKQDIDRIVSELEKEIDELQDDLDKFNATNSIEISVPECVERPYAPVD